MLLHILWTLPPQEVIYILSHITTTAHCNVKAPTSVVVQIFTVNYLLLPIKIFLLLYLTLVDKGTD